MDERKRREGKNANETAKPDEPWHDPDDSPEWTDEMFDRAEVREGVRLIRRGRQPNDDKTHPERV